MRALWGEMVAAPLQTFGDLCSLLCSMITMDLTKRLPKLIADREVAEWRSGAGRREQLEDFARLIEDWAAPYLGRAGTIEMSEDELAARTWRMSGIPEEQVLEIVEANALAREARQAGRSRREVAALVEQWRGNRRATRTLSTKPLDGDGVSGRTILSELDRLVADAVSRGETSLKIRLPALLDTALENAMMKNAGAVSTILGEHVAGIARRHPAITYLQLAAGGLPETGWRLHKHQR